MELREIENEINKLSEMIIIEYNKILSSKKGTL